MGAATGVVSFLPVWNTCRAPFVPSWAHLWPDLAQLQILSVWRVAQLAEVSRSSTTLLWVPPAQPFLRIECPSFPFKLQLGSKHLPAQGPSPQASSSPASIPSAATPAPTRGWIFALIQTKLSPGDPGASQHNRALVVHPPGTTVLGQRGFQGYHLWMFFSLMMANGRNSCLTGAAVAYGLSSGRNGAPAEILNLSFGI